MKRKILLYSLLLTLFATLVTGVFSVGLVRKYYTYEVGEKLKTSAAIIAAQLRAQPADLSRQALSQQLRDLATSVDAVSTEVATAGHQRLRLTVVARDGTVIADTEQDPSTMENHSDRPEIMAALEGSTGTSIRASRTLNLSYDYLAMPIRPGGDILRVSVPLTQLSHINESIVIYVLAIILFSLALTTLLAFRVLSSITLPIQELIRVSRDITRGHYARRAEIRSDDELGQFAQTFNTMAEQLEHTLADLTDRNEKLDTFINAMISGMIAVDRKQRVIMANVMATEIFGVSADPANLVGQHILDVVRNPVIFDRLGDAIARNSNHYDEIRLGGAEERLLRVYTSPIKSKDYPSTNTGGIIFVQDITKIRKLEQIRTDFVSNVTHELKTPLTSIRGFIETLRAGAVNDPSVADKFLEIIDIEAERLTMLINDILQLSEIEHMGSDINLSPQDAGGIARETAAVLTPVAEKKQVQLLVETDGDVQLLCNRDRIKQMLINVIENGIKYNHPGGRVHVRVYGDPAAVNITVSDSGIGIPPEHTERIFERFYRVDKGRSRQMGGTGLGLSIVKHIVNLYHGDIRVRSVVGEGTTFDIRLPR